MNRRDDDECSIGVMDEDKAAELNELFGDDLEAIAKNNSELVDILLGGETKTGDVSFEVINGDTRTRH